MTLRFIVGRILRELMSVGPLRAVLNEISSRRQTKSVPGLVSLGKSRLRKRG